jgi:DNA-binding phage protein
MYMALTRQFKETLVARAARDDAFVRAMLDEALTFFLNGDAATAKEVLRDVVNATIGFEALAIKVKKPSKSLHRMLSKGGNPTMDSLSAILGAIRKALRVNIKAVVKAA